MIEKDVVVIGAGISGLATAKCLKDDGFDVVILERSSDIGGLWNYREDDYGVMNFTHINVSKYNYAFSDYPFPDDVPDYPHHTDMCQYIRNYTKHFGIQDLIQFNSLVVSLEQIGDKWKVMCRQKQAGSEAEGQEVVYVSQFVAVCSGHHAKPTWPKFRGQETFSGNAVHSVDFKSAIYNKCVERRVLVVGIGNSAVDVAVDCVATGRCKQVYISTRSGAWVFPNYLFGYPTDLYASRAHFQLPHKLANTVMEAVITLVSGSPRKWGLNPKMRALETQPTVSPTLIHHIQRGNIKIVPNVTSIEGSQVNFVNGVSAEFDDIIYCTGYTIDLPFLSSAIKEQVLSGEKNHIRLYKNVFSPDVGSSLAFIGFAQPASGGLLSMSEMQARWFSKLCKGEVKLPSKAEMDESIQTETRESQARWYKSDRHTIQRDPLPYNDELAAMIGAKPDLVTHPKLAWRLLLGSGGVAQYRLDGPNKWTGAADQIRKTPVTALWRYSAIAALCLVGWIIYWLFSSISSLFG